MRNGRLERSLVIVALAAALGGCDTYLARRDAITSGAGDTVRVNIVAQADDMQPRGAADPNLVFSAERLTRRAPGASPAVDPAPAGASAGLTDGAQQIARSALGRVGAGR